MGLAGFALTTILLNIDNAGFFPLSVMILGMGVFYGGPAQLIAGIMEYKQGNTIGKLVASAGRAASRPLPWAADRPACTPRTTARHR
nr:acetate uptake transporter [Bordetella sp. BOR01]